MRKIPFSYSIKFIKLLDQIPIHALIPNTFVNNGKEHGEKLRDILYDLYNDWRQSNKSTLKDNEYIDDFEPILKDILKKIKSGAFDIN